MPKQPAKHSVGALNERRPWLNERRSAHQPHLDGEWQSTFPSRPSSPPIHASAATTAVLMLGLVGRPGQPTSAPTCVSALHLLQLLLRRSLPCHSFSSREAAHCPGRHSSTTARPGRKQRRHCRPLHHTFWWSMAACLARAAPPTRGPCQDSAPCRRPASSSSGSSRSLSRPTQSSRPLSEQTTRCTGQSALAQSALQ